MVWNNEAFLISLSEVAKRINRLIDSKDERKVESMLLQERWRLIQQGTNRKNITIRKSEILVGKLLHAKVIDQKLVYRSPVNTNDNSNSVSAEAEMDQTDNQ